MSTLSAARRLARLAITARVAIVVRIAIAARLAIVARVTIVALFAGPAWALPAHAQDFAAPAPAWPPGGACLMLERGVPTAQPRLGIESATIRWHGLAALTTRAVAGTLGWRAVRAAAGLSQTGEPDVGWTTLALAIGAAGEGGGGALRAAARRDRTTPFGFDARGADVGMEVGGGAWIEAAASFHVWVVAPQLWAGGAAPPLARPLEVGAALDLGGVALWLGRAAVAGYPNGGRGEHMAGLATTVGPLDAWLVARDLPLRGSLGLAARARALRAAAEIESHPLLGQTARLSLGLGGER